MGSLGMVADGLDEYRVLRQAEQLSVKAHVQAKELAQIATFHRIIMGVLDRQQSLQALFRDRKLNEADTIGFEQLANLVEMLDLFDRIGLYQRANIAFAFDKPHLLKLRKSVPYRMALESEARHQIVFDQALARVQRTEHNFFFQRLDY